MSSFFGRFFNSSTMKRIVTSLLAALFCIALFAADLNPFAYNLYTSTNADGGTRLHFSINALAPTVEVYIVVGGVEKKIRTYSNVAKNNYSTDLTASDAASAGLTAGSSYSWKVKVTTPDRSSAAEYVGKKVADKPIFSMDIDNNPTSPYFGRILATHGTDNIANAQGIYAYNAAFEADGGRNMGATAYANWWSGNHLTPYRIRIAQDGSGRIFLANYDPSQTGAYLWLVDPAKLTSWTQLIARSWMKSNVGINADGSNNALDVYNFGLDIRTSDNKYELLLLSANVGGSQFVTGQVYSGIYTIPNITAPTTGVSYKQLKWNKVTGEQSIRNLFGSAINSSAIFDKYGGAWYCGNSSNGTQPTYPGLAHQFATATDYKIDYEGKKEFLIDASIFKGSSGSPILICNIGSFNNANGELCLGNRIKFLGVQYRGEFSKYQQNIFVKNEEDEFVNAPDILSAYFNDLGFCVKSECLLDFKSELEKG